MCLGQIIDQSEFQNMYIDIGGGDDDSVDATLGSSCQLDESAAFVLT